VDLLGGSVPPEVVLSHPRHEAAQKRLPELIGQLRGCSSVEEGYQFQQALLGEVLAAETARNAFSRAVKRIGRGKAPVAGTPEPQSGMDVSLSAAWELERDVCERVARQYRCVGDALAWRVLGFQRKFVIALSQNAPPGVMAGKAGLAAELAEVENARAGGRFALLHDLSNCLRIGDVTVFGEDGVATTIEVKSDPARRRTVQLQRIAAAAGAARGQGPLPGQDRKTILYDLDLPFRTHLKTLQDGTMRAASEGLFAARIPGDRALLAADLHGCSAQGWTPEQFGDQADRKLRTVLRRAGLGVGESLVMASSLDSVGRDPLRVPFAAYPLHPVTCARIIGDLALFSVVTSGPILAESLRRSGIPARWTRPPGPGTLMPGEVVMDMTATASNPVSPALASKVGLGGRNLEMEFSRTLQMRRSELDMYLIQLLDQDTWIEGIRYMLADPALNARPWPHYKDEDQVWT
jgi:hypothetical protein